MIWPQAAFLILIGEFGLYLRHNMTRFAHITPIASVLSPPSDPFLIVIEREVLIISLVALTWG